MADLGAVPWPPEPLTTSRLLLRRTEARDRDACVDLMCSDDVQRYLGGARPREEVEREVPEVPGDRPGVFAVEADGALIGNVFVNRRDADRPGHLREQGEEVEIGYLFLPASWGHGYATEAVAAVLEWVEQVLPGEAVVLCTQTANAASVRLATRLGFVEAERFVEVGAEQWFGVRLPRDVASRPRAASRVRRV
jgi:RimJ/RimL family protein N-acetyltransferase